MDSFRQIVSSDYAKISVPSSFGRPHDLKWIAITDLVIDPAYQREITIVGRKNVRNIAQNFKWSMFAPVVVAAAGSKKYAIVDGQHRTTAALLCGIDKVPCAIIEAPRAGQAAAFKAINGNTTRIHSIQLHHAAVAAGEPEACAIDAVCKKAGVTVLRFPTQTSLHKPGETLAPATIGKALARFGDKSTVAGLKAIVETGGGNPGLLVATVILGVIEVLHDHQEWLRDRARLYEAFDEFDLDDVLRRGQALAAKTKGLSARDRFEAELIDALESAMRNSKKVRA